MASLDKTYIKTYQQYREIADWCKAQGEVHWRNSVFRPYDRIPQMTEWDEETDKVVYLGEWTEEYFNERARNVVELRECVRTESYFNKYVDKKEYPTLEDWFKYVDSWEVEICLWNTDIAFDVYLIQNCPVQFIQDRLKEMYGNEYENIKNHRSIYDTFKREVSDNPHFVIRKILDSNHRNRDYNWIVSINSSVKESVWYDERDKNWYFKAECHITKDWEDLNYATSIKGKMTNRKIYRLIRRWNLPKGTRLFFSHPIFGREAFEVIVK